MKARLPAKVFVPVSAERADLPRILQIQSPRYVKADPDSGAIAASDIPQISNGHFSLEFFLNRRRHAITVANAMGDNLLPFAAEARFDLAINTVSCPDMHGSDLVGIARFLDQKPNVPVINAPRDVMETSRDRLHQRLQGIDGLRVPKIARAMIDGPPGVMANRLCRAALRPPLILRRTGTHTGVSMMRALDEATLLDALGRFEQGQSIFATAFVDYRNDQGLFNKFRVFFIDGKLHPVVNLFSPHWNVHSADRYRLMFVTPELREREERYLAGPQEFLGRDVVDVLHKIAQIVRLDFFGIDFTVLPSGEVLLFEANAAMRHNFDHAQSFPYTRPNLERISSAFQQMIRRRIAGYTDEHFGHNTASARMVKGN
ncbi:MAG: hypothetical protein AAF666_13475 [Pseudomonadota bacterium]